MKIYMPAPFPQPLMENWPQGYRLDVDKSGQNPSKEQMKEHLADADAVVLNLDDVFDRELIDAAPKLRVISLFAGSTYNIDAVYAQSRNIALCTVQGEIYENTADLTLALLLAVARRIPEADAHVRQGHYTQWNAGLLLGSDIYGKTLGILGLGTIGAAVARRAKGFGMQVFYTAAHGPKPALESELGCRYLPLEELVQRADFLSLHCKLDETTHHLMDEKRLFSMKKGAYLINTGRGALVDETALALALQQGHLGGAALDVFEFEPCVTEELKTLPNTVLSPHLGASTKDNRLPMAEILKTATLQALEGPASPPAAGHKAQ